MRIAAVALMLCVGCGGASSRDPDPALDAPVSAPAPTVPQRVVTDREAFLLSGLDCSTAPCPAVANLQCLGIATKKQCYFVLQPGDGCLGVKVDRTSTGESTPLICAPLPFEDIPGVGGAGCINGLDHVVEPNGAAQYCFH